MTGHSHLQVHKLTVALIKDQGLTELKMNKLDGGQIIPMCSKKKYEEHNEQLQEVIER
jgi:hypothetical protein